MTSTLVDWWTSTKSSPKMFRPPGLTERIEKYLRDHDGIDAHSIALTLKLNISHVLSYQRWLGLRKLAENNPKGGRRCR